MRKRWSRIFALSLGVSLVVAMLAACGAGVTSSTTSTGSTGSTTIKIATELPVSGKDASNGKPTENGAHLAVDQANQQHLVPGYTFVFVPRDDVGPNGTHDPAVGEQNVSGLIGDALVAGIVGPFNSSVAQGEMPEANQAPIALVSASVTNDCLTQTEPAAVCSGANNKIGTYRPTGKVTFFRIATRDQFPGVAIADYAYKTKGYRSAYFIDDAETYGIGIVDSISSEWQKLGATLLGRSSEPATTTTYVSLLTQIAAKKPDVIFFGGEDSTGGILIRQQMVQVRGLKETPFYSSEGILTSTFAKAIGPYKSNGSNGAPVYSASSTVNINALPSAQQFVAAYDKAYGAQNLGAYSGGGYDCAMILIQAIKAALATGVKTPANSGDAAQAKVFRQAVINAIQQINYNGVTGHYTFDQNGDITNRILYIYTIADDPNQGNGWKFVSQMSV